MKQSFSNISELTKLHDLAIFFGGGGEMPWIPLPRP